LVCVEQGDLRTESWIALDCVSNAVILVNDEIICENTVYLKFLSEAISPSLDLLVVFMAPVKA